MDSKLKNYIKPGFTLIELVVSILIMGIIGLLATRMLFQGADIYFQQTGRQKLTSQARMSFSTIMKDIRNQVSASSFYLTSSDTLMLLDAADQNRKYCIRDNGNLIMVKNSNSYTLADSISAAKTNFSYYDNNFTSVTPSAGNTLTESEASNVRLTKVDIFFTRGTDTLDLSSYAYPHNFRFGQKKSYHD